MRHVSRLVLSIYVIEIVLTVLKLTGAISWSWWGVAAPLWLYLGIWLTLALLVSLWGLVVLAAWALLCVVEAQYH